MYYLFVGCTCMQSAMKSFSYRIYNMQACSFVSLDRLFWLLINAWPSYMAVNLHDLLTMNLCLDVWQFSSSKYIPWPKATYVTLIWLCIYPWTLESLRRKSPFHGQGFVHFSQYTFSKQSCINMQSPRVSNMHIYIENFICKMNMIDTLHISVQCTCEKASKDKVKLCPYTSHVSYRIESYLITPQAHHGDIACHGDLDVQVVMWQHLAIQ